MQFCSDPPSTMCAYSFLQKRKGRRYHRSFLSFSDEPETEYLPAYDEQVEEDIVDEENNIDMEVVLNDRKKHSLVMPILMRLGNLIACHPTKKFLQYLHGLNELEQRVRKGQNFMLQMNRIVAQAEDEDEDGEESDGEHAAELHNDEEAAVDDTVVEGLRDESQDTVVQDDTSQEDSPQSGTRKRKFSDIKFKMGLKTKGRPKQRSRQFTFNKSAADRKAKAAQKKKKKEESAAESDSSEDDADDIELKLTDDSESEFDSEEDEEITFKD